MRTLIILLVVLVHGQIYGQRFISNETEITFFSEAPLENIKAVNKKATSIFDLGSGEIAFSVPIREFAFRKSLMKKHFNENYMDSDKFPKSTFKGMVTGYQVTDGDYQATASGEMTIHGVTRKIQVNGKLIKNGEEVVLEAVFPVSLEDYDIKIPKILFSNIAENVEVTVQFTYGPYIPN